MTWPFNQLPEGKKVYFASDFHLGSPNEVASCERERALVRWLDQIRGDAAAILLVGDIFDFWFEFRYVIPKGFIRLQGKLAELVDSGIPVIFFTGNHDMWMFDYFPQELGIPIVREPVEWSLGSHRFLIGHGDGLGPGDASYKFLKRIFANKLCQRAFAFLHPWIGFGIATRWSKHSRAANAAQEELLAKESEWLYQYCREVEARQHHDFYIFGHRHLPLDLEVGLQSRYINLGEWFSARTYAVYDGNRVELLPFTS